MKTRPSTKKVENHCFKTVADECYSRVSHQHLVSQLKHFISKILEYWVKFFGKQQPFVFTKTLALTSLKLFIFNNSEKSELK